MRIEDHYGRLKRHARLDRPALRGFEGVAVIADFATLSRRSSRRPEGRGSGEECQPCPQTLLSTMSPAAQSQLLGRNEDHAFRQALGLAPHSSPWAELPRFPIRDFSRCRNQVHLRS